MITQTSTYQLPDQGFALIRWAHELAAGRAAVVVEAEVERVRRPDGALAPADISAFRKRTDGPLSVLRLVLELEEMAVRAWGKGGFARFHKWSAGRQIARLHRTGGVEAAVAWALANGSERLRVDALRDLLGPRLYRTGSFDEEFFKAELARTLQERRRQRERDR